MTEFCDKDVILSGQIEFCDIHRIIKTHEKSVVKWTKSKLEKLTQLLASWSSYRRVLNCNI